MRTANGANSALSEASFDESPPSDHLPLRIAFYLPQFHQTPENDAWHGTGFTEWSVVAEARPLFPGQFQPHLPGELGFYDLRLPETRELQVRLARSHGISGFCYYHYWFNGRRMLERPFHEVLRSGKPDFPFCLCWANESWYRRWQGSTDELVIEQTFDEQDDVQHIRWMIEAFKDRRYIRVKGRPLLAIYRPLHLPDPERTVEIWRNECADSGIPAPWLVGFETTETRLDPNEIGLDASAEFVPHGVNEIVAPMKPPPSCDPSNTIYEYSKVASAYGGTQRSWIHYPCVATGWDNTPRRRNGEALIMMGATPERYRVWLEHAIERQLGAEGSDGVVFINAWNEWAEGAHLEPDIRDGRAYLEATRDAVLSIGATLPPASSEANLDVPPVASIEDLYADLYERSVQLQNYSSGYMAIADRRLQSWREYYEKELDTQRETNRTLAEWCLSLEEQVKFLEGELAVNKRSPRVARDLTRLSMGRSDAS